MTVTSDDELIFNVRLQLLLLVIGLKISRQFFNQWEAKPKAIAPRRRNFSRALSNLPVIAGNSDWFISLFAPVAIGQNRGLKQGRRQRQRQRQKTMIWLANEEK